jgi:hypothetical protein
MDDMQLIYLRSRIRRFSIATSGWITFIALLFALTLDTNSLTSWFVLGGLSIYFIMITYDVISEKRIERTLWNSMLANKPIKTIKW